ncbi:hypothetical protein PFISCL1PPCAC_1800, partial [Pristionchus fissidentatus]
EDDEEEEEVEPTPLKLIFAYDKWVGGFVRSRVIESPPFYREFSSDRWKIRVPADHNIRIRVEKMEVPEDNPMRIYAKNDEYDFPVDDPIVELSGYTPQADFTIEQSEINIYYR